jgi:hypothetical protein
MKFKKSIIGVKDPIWWFRAGSALNITTYRHLNRRKFLIGWDELMIRRIVAFIDNGRYYSNYVYVEAQGEKPTELYDHYTTEMHAELIGKEISIFDLKVMGVYGAVARGVALADALKRYKLTREQYEKNIERVLST